MSSAKLSLPKGAILPGKKEYRIEKVLGNGGFGITYLATSSFMDGNISRRLHYTIKEFFMSNLCDRDEKGAVVVTCNDDSEIKEHMLSFQKEAEHLLSLKHPNIVPVNEIFRANNTLYYVMEFLGDLCLTQYIEQKGGKLTEQQAMPIILALAEALRALHDKRMNHLDIKPDNVMMLETGDGLRPVLIDFGLSKHYNMFGKMTVAAGTTGVSHGYSPLEQYAGVDSFSPQVDIYALGATLFYMLTGKVPCKSAEISEAYLNEHLPKDLSDSVREMVMMAMKKDSADRLATVDAFVSMYKSAPAPVVSSAPESDSNETVVISVPGKKAKAKKASSAPSFNAKKLALPLGILAAVVVLGTGGYFVMQNLPESAPEAEQPALVEETTTPAESAEVQTAEPEATKPEAAQPQATQPEQQESAAKPAAKTAAPNEDVVYRKNLGYALWEGPVVNGKPDGSGTMTFSKPHDLGNGRMAEPGDYIKGNYYEGVLESGKWYSADGTLKETIIQ